MTATLPQQPAWAASLDADVIIIGVGFGGLGMAIQLKKAVTSFLVLECASDVGGTWRDNIYPGCACDIPAMLYSFSFASRVGWTRVYPQQAEILAYVRRVAKKQRLYERIRFNSELSEARFDGERTGTWTVTLTDGTILRSRFLVSAMGPLSKPKLPDIPGRERFTGAAFHSAQWDYSVDIDSKQVVAIGTGASAIQFVPQIAPHVAKLTIFQRTPPWIIPRNDRPIGSVRPNPCPDVRAAHPKGDLLAARTPSARIRHESKTSQTERKRHAEISRALVTDPALRAKLYKKCARPRKNRHEHVHFGHNAADRNRTHLRPINLRLLSSMRRATHLSPTGTIWRRSCSCSCGLRQKCGRAPPPRGTEPGVVSDRRYSGKTGRPCRAASPRRID
jgi:cation diffusion facilitator CzcD-associated flavoprotein CzcO